MSFFGAMTTAISAIRSQANALGHISDNIANSRTAGFKRTDTSFSEIVTHSSGRQHAPGTVMARPAFTNIVQGNLEASDVQTHMAVNGNGYFIVSERIATVDNEPVFLDVDRYTRRGDFEVDKDGYLVNGSGYYLQGLMIDTDTGNPVGDVPDLIQLSNDLLPARATTEIDYRANLPSYPQTVLADPTVANSELMLPGAFVNDPTAGNDEFVRADEESLFLDRSLAGGAITVFDTIGQPLNVQLRWAKIDNAANGGGTGLGDTWNLFYKEDSTATGANPMWRNVGTNYTFANGVLTPAINSVNIAAFTIDGTAVGAVTLDHGASDITQFADTNGTVSVNDIDQDGFAAGELAEIAVSDNGRIVGTFTNGKQIDLAEVTLARFNAENSLRKLDGGAFAQTQESGVAIFGAAGEIIAEANEASNVDIAEEFSKLIVTQQAYTAGTRIVTTSDELIRETLNMKR